MSGRTGSTGGLVEAVEAFVDAHEMLPDAVGVIVAVSGGADSVCLLSVLVEIARARGLRLTVAHLDHALRSGSGDDASFVRGLAERWGLPVVSGRRDVCAEAKAAGEGIEQAARRIRYEFLAAAAREGGAQRVAVGHNADDNVETILYRIVRGTHIRGLAGIRPVRRLEPRGPILVRPLLGSRRTDIEAYCRAAGLPWRTDETNADVRFRRNFIRHELLPLLRDHLNVRADEALLRIGQAAGEVQNLLEAMAEAALDRSVVEPERDRRDDGIVLDAGVLAAEPRLVRTCALRAALDRLGASMGSIGTERLGELDGLLKGPQDGAVALAGALEARRSGKRLVLGRAERHRAEATSIPLTRPGRTSLPGGGSILCEHLVLDRRAFSSHCAEDRPHRQWLDADQVRGPLLCRSRRPGDSFRPLGAPGTQSVGDFLTNAKVPVPERRKVRCVCDELGVVYLAPLRIDERVKVTGRTQRVLRITFEGG